MINKRFLFKVLVLVLFLTALPVLALAQDEAPVQQVPIETDDNNPGSAILLECGESRFGMIHPAGDVDYFRLRPAHSHTIVITTQALHPGVLDSVLDLYSGNGTTFLTNNDDFDGLDSRLHWTPQPTSTAFHDVVHVNQYVKIRDLNGGAGAFHDYLITWDYPFYVSMTTSGMTADGVEYEKGDILVYYECQRRWEMVFDASDVLLPGNVRDFAFSNGDPTLPNRHGHIFMALDKQNVPGVGPVMANDLVAFRPDNLGAQTEGNFYWLFDGSDVGLTTKNERIDGLALINSFLLLSTNGRGSVPNTGGFQDEDVLLFAPANLSDETSGTWASVVYFDGSDEGLGNVDTQGIWLGHIRRPPDTSELIQHLVATFDKPVILYDTVQPYQATICRYLSAGESTDCGSWSIRFNRNNKAGLPASAVLDGYDEGTHWWPAGFAPTLNAVEATKPAQE